MSRTCSISVIFVVLIPAMTIAAYIAPSPPFAPPAGMNGSLAVHYQDELLKSWATSVREVSFGTEISEDGGWKNTANALGPSKGGGDGVVVLGRGGAITLEFHSSIQDGDGSDFVVFENAFSDTFLELAYVEVSSDGTHFVRFPGYSLTADPVGSWGHVQAELVDGFAGKYRSGYGTPFDLSVLKDAHAAVLSGYDRFSQEYSDQLLQNFPHLDTGNVRYVRIIDIVGDGTFKDCEGFPVYDPFPTILTAGFDLDAVGVMNPGLPGVVAFADWAGQRNLSGDAGADFDGDGWADAIEYHFNSDPRDDCDIPQFSLIESAGQGSYGLVYYLSATAEGRTDVFSSPDGQTWSLLEAGVSNPPDAGDLVWVAGSALIRRTQSIPAEGESLFQFRVSGIN